MSDIETYLTQLRSHLADLHPKRADEIIAEARTHLESRAAQLRTAGVGEGEAMSEALAAFGDPSQVAQDLIQGNSRHRRPIALRVVAAVVMTFGTLLALGILILGVVVFSNEGVSMLPANLAAGPAATIVKFVGSWSILLLIGIVGGRRFWWIAALPGCAMIAWVLLSLSLTSPTIRAEAGPSVFTSFRSLVALAVSTALMASIAWLGSRLPRRLSAATKVVSGSVVGLIWLGAIMVLVTVSRLNQAKTELEVQHYGALAAIVMPVVLAFLIAGLRDRYLSRTAFILSVAGLLGVGLLLAVLVAGACWDAGPASVLLAIPILLCFTGLVAILIYTVQTRSTATASLPPAESK